MPHVRGGNGTLRLNAVPAKAGSTIEPSFEAGTFTFKSDDVRTHYVEFTVTDGDLTATGLVRIDVAAPPDANTRPITVPQTIFVTTLSNQIVDPTQTDIDPAGGVLVVTGVTNVDPNGPIQAEVLDQREVRVTLARAARRQDGDVQLPDQQRARRGRGHHHGRRAPDPRPAAAAARDRRRGDRPRGRRHRHPGARQRRPSGRRAHHPAARARASRCPTTAACCSSPATACATWRRRPPATTRPSTRSPGPTGRPPQARVTMSVREIDAATNNAPTPRRVTARVLAGETVQIEIPLSGVDPDGDSVQLIGIASNPEKGSVLSVGPGFIEYEAGDYSTGTDTFSYSVTDALGARAEGTVRVGISPPLDGTRNPVANTDEVTVRPGRSVSVQVLANDSDPDGSPLTVTTAEPNTDETTAVIEEDAIVTITPPEVEGDYSVIYTIQNESGGTSSAFVYVKVDADAPLGYPVAQDTVLGRQRRARPRHGRRPGARQRLLPGRRLERARRRAGGRATPRPRSCCRTSASRCRSATRARSSRSPSRTRTTTTSGRTPSSGCRASTTPSRSSTGRRPSSRSTARTRCGSTSTTTSSRSAATRCASPTPARCGRRTRTATTSSSTRTRSSTPRPTSTSVPPPSRSRSRTARPRPIRTGDTAILTLPIDVQPRDNQPPAFNGGTVNFEPGEEKELDLVRLTNYPYDDDLDELVYSVLPPPPEGFTLRAQRSAPGAPRRRDRRHRIVDVDRPDGAGCDQRGPRRAASSCRWCPRPARSPSRSPTAPSRSAARPPASTCSPTTRRTTRSPRSPLRVIDIRGLSGGALPDGVDHHAERRQLAAQRERRRRRRTRSTSTSSTRWRTRPTTRTATCGATSRSRCRTSRIRSPTSTSRSSATGCSSCRGCPASSTTRRSRATRSR